jgi:uncharacterized protein (TIGR02270 family)
MPSKFSAALFAEYLEEASFLYQQRGALFHDPEITWLEIGEFEERFETHIDALVVGGDPALYVCQQQILEGDSGELHAAVRVFCRQKRMDLIQLVLDGLDIEDDERVLAVRNALKQEWPEDWNQELSRMLEQVPDKSIAVMPAVAGFKRIPAEGALSFVLPICPECALFPQIKSMGRLQSRSAQAGLYRHLEHKDPGIQGAAALSLLRMGLSLAQAVPDDPGQLKFWQLMHIALAGGPEYVPRLLDRIAGSGGTADEALVLGVLGDPRSIDALIRFLGKQEEAETVALALNLITGADLYEEVFVPAQIDEDELFDEEIEKLKRGESIFAPGEEPGVTLVQLSRAPQKWDFWWQQHRSGFEPGRRFRNGKPYHPECLLANLCSEKSPILARQLAYEELVIRYGIDIPFETDMTVKDQLRALEKIKSAIAAHAGRFHAGTWYFAGREIQ